jgi:hypothetical protein
MSGFNQPRRWKNSLLLAISLARPATAAIPAWRRSVNLNKKKIGLTRNVSTI